MKLSPTAGITFKKKAPWLSSSTLISLSPHQLRHQLNIPYLQRWRRQRPGHWRLLWTPERRNVAGCHDYSLSPPGGRTRGRINVTVRALLRLQNSLFATWALRGRGRWDGRLRPDALISPRSQQRSGRGRECRAGWGPKRINTARVRRESEEMRAASTNRFSLFMSQIQKQRRQKKSCGDLPQLRSKQFSCDRGEF